ncbi:MAG TPA: DUF1553 domain-containing protein [Pirellulales bacterium]|nr:DUF1553 domain-containing protein [Pirellulales bacterium]
MSARRRRANLVSLTTATAFFGACLFGATIASRAADEPPGSAPPADRAAAEFFEKKVRPLLVARCQECHGPKQQKGGLRLDSLAAIVTGGDSGPALAPGKPDDSLLVDAVRYGQVFQMPPKGKLPEEEVAVLVEWVRRGAPWPNAEPITAKPAASTTSGPAITDEQRSFWAFRPPAEPPLPKVKNAAWVASPLDRFVLAELEAKGLSPAPAADRRMLIRRASFDLTGLPPTPEEVDAFLADQSPGAFERVVDRLLASLHYGERWGRHWLDVARYADSNGLDENLAYINAYRYRDYVVSAFNRDLPYDQFVVEQLAGDLLPGSGDPETDYQRIVATGFLSLGAKMLAEDDPVKMEMDIIDEQLDTLGVTFMGLTLGCARCHDHKFDPIPSADYYSLAGILKSTRTMDNFNVVAVWHERPLASKDEIAAVEGHQKLLAEKKAAVEARGKAAAEALSAAFRRDVARYLLVAGQLAEHSFDLQALMPKPDAEPPVGAIIVEAENFVRGQATKLFDGYGAGIGVIASFGPEASFAEYEVQIATPGVYQIELRYAAQDSRPVKLFVDGALVKPDAANQRTGSWNPDTQTWFVEAWVTLAAGVHTLRLERREPFPHLDRLALIPRSLPEEIDPAAFQLATAEAAAGGALNRAVLDRWRQALKRSEQDPKSPLYAWHVGRAASNQAAQAKPDAASPVTASVLRDPPPTTAAQLAERYGELFQQAIAAQEAATENAAGKSDQQPDEAAIETLRKLLYDPAGPCAPPAEAEHYFPPSDKDELVRLREEQVELEQSAPAPLPLAMAVEDREPVNLKIHIRGNHLTQGELAPRRFPRVIAGENQPALPADRSGRLELARWLVDPNHPLTGRVMVNRVWRWHFGEGIVRSTDNFGRLGERPTHPELLDWLARRFVESGWSLKALHRLIMLSSTYRMSTAYSAASAEIDPENRRLWRMNRRRLEAEAVRDAILAVSGSLDPALGGRLLKANARQYVASTTSVDIAQYQSFRRSLYLPVIRSALYETFQAFDFAEPSVPNGSRATTTVAPQALFMMNGPLVAEETKRLADKLLAETGIDDAARVRLLYERAFSRPPNEAESAQSLEFVARLEAAPAWQALPAAERRGKAWQSLCRVAISSSEFIFLE